MAYIRSTFPGLDIARGLIAGQSLVQKFGRNDTITAAEDIWMSGGTYAGPAATAATVACVSSSAADTSAGTGARTMTVTGINGSYAEVTETVTLNGVTPVNTANSYFVIHRVIVATAGTGATNAGTITLTSNAAGTPILGTVAIGMGQTQIAIYMIPDGYTGYLMRLYCSTQGSGTNTADIQLFVKPFGGVFNLKCDMQLDDTASSLMQHDFSDAPIAIAAKSLIKLRATPSGGTFDISGGFDLVLVLGS